MDMEAAVQNIRAYVKQQEEKGIHFKSAFDIADQLGLPVSLVSRALQGLNQEGNEEYPYDTSVEY